MHSRNWNRLIEGAMVVAVLLFAPGCRRASSPVSGERFVTALAKYARDLKTKGEQIPASVSLDALVRIGYLRSDDAQAFQGTKVVFHLDADETEPQSMLVEATMPDGILFAVMGDGSVQRFSRQRLEDYRKQIGQPAGAANRSQPGGPETNRTPSAADSAR